MSMEVTILSNLIHNENFARKALPFIQNEYFEQFHQKVVFQEIKKFFDSYNSLPSRKILTVEIGNNQKYQSSFEDISDLLSSLDFVTDNIDWLMLETEKFCKKMALFNAILESVTIIDGKNENKTPESIPSLLTEALSVCFDNRVGHDFIGEAEERFNEYIKVENKLPFDLESLNKIFDGGQGDGTLNLVAAGTGIGKSLLMCHIAARTLMMGKNVVYITMEMSEMQISKRIDANLMNINSKDIPNLDRDIFLSKIDKINSKTQGKLIIKQYPTKTAHCGHFNNLLRELRTKQNFEADLVIIDYLGITASAKIKNNGSINPYHYIKEVAEEMRAFAIENNVPVFSGIQVTRKANTDSDYEIDAIAESFGIMHTADICFALIETDELKALNQIMVKQLKNRYSSKDEMERFVLGVDKGKSRFYDVEGDPAAGLTKTQTNNNGISAFSNAVQSSKSNKNSFTSFKF